MYTDTVTFAGSALFPHERDINRADFLSTGGVCVSLVSSNEHSVVINEDLSHDLDDGDLISTHTVVCDDHALALAAVLIARYDELHGRCRFGILTKKPLTLEEIALEVLRVSSRTAAHHDCHVVAR